MMVRLDSSVCPSRWLTASAVHPAPSRASLIQLSAVTRIHDKCGIAYPCAHLQHHKVLDLRGQSGVPVPCVIQQLIQGRVLGTEARELAVQGEEGAAPQRCLHYRQGGREVVAGDLLGDGCGVGLSMRAGCPLGLRLGG